MTIILQNAVVSLCFKLIAPTVQTTRFLIITMCHKPIRWCPTPCMAGCCGYVIPKCGVQHI